MGWIKQEFDETKDEETHEKSAATAGEDSFRVRAEEKWAALLNDLKNDVEEFRRITGKAEFDQPANSQCRISNPQAKIAAVVVADLPEHAIRYSYEPQDANVAVPEQGVLTMRDSGTAVDIYSADQPMTSEQARKLILEPLLFPVRTTEKSPAA